MVIKISHGVHSEPWSAACGPWAAGCPPVLDGTSPSEHKCLTQFYVLYSLKFISTLENYLFYNMKYKLRILLLMFFNRFNLFRGCHQTKTCTIVLRGGAEQFLEETERSLHDAIMIVRRALKHDAVVAGMCWHVEFFLLQFLGDSDV